MSDFNNNNITPDNQIPPVQQPEFEVPPQPIQFEQPQFEQQPFYNGTPGNNMPPKKSKKKFAGLIAAVVGVAACVCVAVFAGPKIIDALSSGSKAAPLDRFKNAIQKTNEEFAENVKENENTNATAENQELTTNFQLELGEYTKEYIPEEYVGLTNIIGSLDVINYSGQQYFNLNLSTPSASIVTLEGFSDSANGAMYFQIPELSDSYLSASYYLDASQYPTVDIDPITPDEIAKLYSDEVSALLDQIKTVEIDEDSSITAAGITASYDKLTTTMTHEEFSNVVYNWYKRLTEERYFTELFDFYANMADTTDSYSEITIEDSLKELKSWADTNTMAVALDLYLDEDDNIVGLVMRPQIDNASAEFGYLTAEKGKETGFEVFAKDGDEYLMKVDGSYTSSNDVYNGSAALTTYLDGSVDVTAEIEFKDFTTADKKVKGILTLTSSEMMGLSLSADMNIDNSVGTMKLSALMSGMDLGAISFDFALKEATSCPTLPDNAVVYDSNDDVAMEEYMSSSDIYGFLDNLYTATGIDLTSLMYDMY